MTAPELETPPSDGPSVERRRPLRRRIIVIAGAVVVGLVIFVFVYFEPHTAFIDDEVSETIPGLDPVLAAETSAPTIPGTGTGPTTSVAPATSGTGSATTATSAAPTVSSIDADAGSGAEPDAGPDVAAVDPGNSVAAGIAAARASGVPVVLSSAEFFSGEHSTTGTALVVAVPDGTVVVRFEGLDTSNGPDLRVVLSPDEASDSWEYSDRLILDELKGNVGDQNYVIGDGVDLTGYRSVVIWCERFSVAFGAAALDVQT